MLIQRPSFVNETSDYFVWNFCRIVAVNLSFNTMGSCKYTLSLQVPSATFFTDFFINSSKAILRLYQVPRKHSDACTSDFRQSIIITVTHKFVSIRKTFLQLVLDPLLLKHLMYFQAILRMPSDYLQSAYRPKRSSIDVFLFVHFIVKSLRTSIWPVFFCRLFSGS